FILNETYTYSPELDEDEIAAIAHVIYDTGDRKLAAVSEEYVVGVAADSRVAMALHQADRVLGTIVRGHNEYGHLIPKDSVIPGYRNPLLGEARMLRGGDLRSIRRNAVRRLHSVGFTFFIRFRDVIFTLSDGTSLVPKRTDIDGTYIALTQGIDS